MTGTLHTSALFSSREIQVLPPITGRFFLTSILCKVLEHIITTNVVSHMDHHNLLYDLQHGFKNKRSSETQLVTLVEDLMRNSLADSQTDLVLLDFSKAFDKVSHQKLLLKLHQYGIRDPSLKWI